MAKPKSFCCFLCFLLVILWSEQVTMGKVIIRVGVVLDMNSAVGKTAERCISAAETDFYAWNADYRTRISLVTRDSKGDVVTAASAALDLMKNEEVEAIIGPQRSSEAKFVIELGAKTHVPILSFSATSPALTPVQSNYFIRTAQSDSSQVEAIASIVKTYGWKEIVLIYEGTEYGVALVPYLLNAFHAIGTRVPYESCIPPSSDDTEIMNELYKIKKKQESVFLVHMTTSMGSKLFLLAKRAEMMSEGYAWLVTTGLSTLLDPVEAKVMDSMDGVLGVKPYVPKSKELEGFKSRWKRNFNSENLFGLWAYDTVWAIAMAVERAGIVHSRFLKQNASSRSVDLAALGISEMGPRLLKSILNTKFDGLSGKFQLVKGEMAPFAFEIFNVVGRSERVIGYWTPKGGLSQSLDSSSKISHSNSKTKLKQPIWPGDTTQQPKKLRIGVPVRSGFSEFIEVKPHQLSNEHIVSGFSAEVFRAVHDILPFPLPYDFIPFMNISGKSAGTYDDLLRQIQLKRFDAVVGDTTIVAYRSSYVDFTLPYSESGVTMVVLMKRDERDSMWIFLKPLTPKLWLVTGLAFFVTGLVVWVLEHRINTEFRGTPEQQLGTVIWFSFSTLVFAHRERPENNLTRFVLIIWMFVVLIISQSYTASLASMLTVQRMHPAFVDVAEIRKNNYFVGHQKGSFVRDFLKKELHLNDTMFREYSTPEEYHDALSRGSHNGGVAAIFDEIPYVKRFLDDKSRCSKFQMVGPTYPTDGFGFAFPLDSPLVSYISRAILNVTEDHDKMEAIKRKSFGREISTCEDQGPETSSGGLRLSSFAGLFLISGVAYISSLLIYIIRFLCSNYPASNTMHEEQSMWLRILEVAKRFDQKDPSVHHLRRSESRVHPVTGPENIGASPETGNVHEMTSNEGAEDIGENQNHDNLTSGNSGTNFIASNADTVAPNTPERNRASPDTACVHEMTSDEGAEVVVGDQHRGNPTSVNSGTNTNTM
uniref:Glutamate receptor n=1 Tax=Populus davidiana TaxID=266767 RepID=A0A6M2F9F9_9ROSI